jgi:hypothetical protein
MGLRKAIDDMCKRCTYDPLDKGTWRQQVEWCGITECPLHPYRPKSSGKREKPANLADISDSRP